MIEISAAVEIANVCVQEYKKPVILMTGNDVQWLQWCSANGYYGR